MEKFSSFVTFELRLRNSFGCAPAGGFFFKSFLLDELHSPPD